MASRPDSVSLFVDVSASPRSARHIARPWPAVSRGMGIRGFTLVSLSALWFRVIPLLLGVSPLARAQSLKGKISAARLANTYRPSDEAGGSGLGRWVGVGIVVLIGVAVVRGRSARARKAAIEPGSATDAVPAMLSPARHESKIPQSSLGEGTTSRLSGASGTRSTDPAGTGPAGVAPLHGEDGPLTTVGATPQSPGRPDRFTPSPALARFVVVPLLASFVLTYFVVRTAGDNTMGAAIPLGLASVVALGLAFYLAPAS